MIKRVATKHRHFGFPEMLDLATGMHEGMNDVFKSSLRRGGVRDLREQDSQACICPLRKGCEGFDNQSINGCPALGLNQVGYTEAKSNAAALGLGKPNEPGLQILSQGQVKSDKV